MQEEPSASTGSTALLLIKVVHTLVWTFFVGCILAIPLASWWGAHQMSAWLSALVAVEVLVLVFNGMQCPLTPVAARFTTDRRENFDIFLPEWLAKHNKPIFGTLYLLGVVISVVRWALTRS